MIPEPVQAPPKGRITDEFLVHVASAYAHAIGDGSPAKVIAEQQSTHSTVQAGSLRRGSAATYRLVGRVAQAEGRGRRCADQFASDARAR